MVNTLSEMVTVTLEINHPDYGGWLLIDVVTSTETIKAEILGH